MKLSCGVTRDLLLLYEDQICCEESRKLVEEHLAECPYCSRFLQKMRITETMAVIEESVQTEEERRLKRGLRGIRRRWAASLIAVLLILPTIYLGIMAYHEYMGEGLCFSNMDEIATCRHFFRLLQKGEFEQAAKMINYEIGYQSITDYMRSNATKEIEEWYQRNFGYERGMSMEDYVAIQEERFVEFMETNQVMLQSVRYWDSYRAGSDWVIGMAVTENWVNMDGTNREYVLDFGITDGKLVVVSAQDVGDIDSDENSLMDAFIRKFD